MSRARAADIRVLRSGLGSVVSYRSVTVKSRVEGQLVRVLFEEGALVERGQVIEDQNEFSGLSQALASPHRGPAVGLEDGWRMRVDAQALQNEVLLGLAPIDVVRKLLGEEVALHGHIADR